MGEPSFDREIARHESPTLEDRPYSVSNHIESKHCNPRETKDNEDSELVTANRALLSRVMITPAWEREYLLPNERPTAPTFNISARSLRLMGFNIWWDGGSTREPVRFISFPTTHALRERLSHPDTGGVPGVVDEVD
jgi:hypothetical protein